MQEQLISFDTAKLAKKKGFHYMKANIYGDNMAYHLDNGQLTTAQLANSVIGYILAPTQSLLQKWIRKKHLLHISIDFTKKKQISQLLYMILIATNF